MPCHHCFAPDRSHAPSCPTYRTRSDLLRLDPSLLQELEPGAILLGSYRLLPLGQAEPIDGRPARGRRIEAGVARTWRLVGPGGVDHVLGDIEWADDNREVRLLRRLPDGDPHLDVLVGRLRLPLEQAGADTWLFHLELARWNEPERPTLCRATSDQLSQAADTAVIATLVQVFDLMDYGPAREIADHRPDLTMTEAGIMGEESHAHLAAFVLTRIAPIIGSRQRLQRPPARRARQAPAQAAPTRSATVRGAR